MVFGYDLLYALLEMLNCSNTDGYFFHFVFSIYFYV
jgi:hypothetical protein